MNPEVISVVGARFNFMKVAPIHRALEASGLFESRIVHAGQHYDERMSDVFSGNWNYHNQMYTWVLAADRTPSKQLGL